MEFFQKLNKVDEINSNNRYQNISFKNQLKEKEEEISNLKDTLKNLDDYKNDKENFHKNFSTLAKNFQNLKEEYEKKDLQLKALQKLTAELKTKKSDIKLNRTTEDNLGNINNLNLTWNNLPIQWKIIIKEKDKKNLLLEKEINKLQNEIDRLNRDFYGIKGNILLLKNKSINNFYDINNNYFNILQVLIMQMPTLVIT